MDITVYLPDQLARRAKEATNLNLSRMLRDALTQHFHEEDTVDKTLEHAKKITLTLQDKEGRTYSARFEGTELAEDVYLTSEGSVLLYDPERSRYWTYENPEEELRGELKEEDYIAVMHALGITPTIDLQL